MEEKKKNKTAEAEIRDEAWPRGAERNATVRFSFTLGCFLLCISVCCCVFAERQNVQVEEPEWAPPPGQLFKK